MVPAVEAASPERRSWLDKLRSGLRKTGSSLAQVFTGAQIDDALYDAFGQRQISILYTQLNQYRVVLEVQPEYRNDPSDIGQMYVSVPGGGDEADAGGTEPEAGDRGGHRVPLSAVTRIEEMTTPLAVTAPVLTARRTALLSLSSI